MSFQYSIGDAKVMYLRSTSSRRGDIFQYSIGDAATEPVATSTSLDEAFNTPLEMPTQAWRHVTGCRPWCAFNTPLEMLAPPPPLVPKDPEVLSILHWRCHNSLDVFPPARNVLPFNTPLEMPVQRDARRGAGLSVSFQYSIGDAERRIGSACIYLIRVAFNTPLEMPVHSVGNYAGGRQPALSILH